MSDLELLAVEIVDDTASLSMAELLACARIEFESLLQLVDAGVLSPDGSSVEQWWFRRRDLRRIRVAQRLIEDLEVNPAGVAVILDLIEERNALMRSLR
jgi:chaperone modulatory protein CbpM